MLVSISGAAPAIAVPALYPRIVVDLPGLTPQLLGIATTAFFALSSVTAPLGGRLADRLGGGRGVQVSAAGSLLVLVAIAVAPTPAALLAAMTAAGVVHGFGLTVSSLALSSALSGASAATQFGIKQSSIPMASLLAGAGLSLAAGVSWRVVLSAFVVFPAAAWGLRPPPEVGGRLAVGAAPPSRHVLNARLVRLLAVAALAGFGVSSLATFGVLSLVRSGWSEAAAGTIYATAAVVSLCSRVLVGAVADRRGDSAIAIAGALLLAGAVGFGLLGAGGRAAAVVGLLLAYGLGWSYTGLMMFAVARANPGRVARATGWLQAGAAVGISAGPALFGLVEKTADPGAAWWTMAACSGLAGLLAILRRGRGVAGRADASVVADPTRAERR
ncbi:MFS transporter [Egicoccus sp. AB-alg2]|uniref:MFS transporter n=1 Tax=Egicoccus sp. AB-alg2 TaxID=3242693 RepID=UPI00359DA3C2